LKYDPQSKDKAIIQSENKPHTLFYYLPQHNTHFFPQLKGCKSGKKGGQ